MSYDFVCFPVLQDLFFYKILTWSCLRLGYVISSDLKINKHWICSSLNKKMVNL